MCNLHGKTHIIEYTDFENVLNQCINSTYISKNSMYSETLKSIIPDWDDGEDIINAYAWSVPEEAREALKAQFPQFAEAKFGISMEGGIVRWIIALAAIAAKLDITGDIRMAKKMLKWCSERTTNYKAGSDFVERFIKDFNLKNDPIQCELSRTYAYAIMAGVIGHELGHICLGHVSNSDGTETNSISRNHEREADLFGISIIQSLNLGSAGAVGGVFFDISMTWMGNRETDEYKYSSHPVDSERINNFLNAFDAQLKYSKINRKMLEKLVNV